MTTILPQHFTTQGTKLLKSQCRNKVNEDLIQTEQCLLGTLPVIYSSAVDIVQQTIVLDSMCVVMRSYNLLVYANMHVLNEADIPYLTTRNSF